MRSAYSGTQGFHPQGAPIDQGNPGFDQGADRLSNIRRSIDSIEQRLMGAAAPVAGYGQPAAPVYAPGNMAPHYPQVGMQPTPQFQPPYGQPMGHAPAGVMYPPLANTAHQMDHIGNEIAKRQQMLNAAANSHPTAQTVNPAPAPAQPDVIGEQLAAVKNELSALKAQVSKPIAVQQSVPQQEIDRIAHAIADIQAKGDASEATFERLASELNELRSAVKGDLRTAVHKGIQASGESQSSGLAKQLEQLGKDVRSAIRSEVKGSHKDQHGDLARRFDELSQGIDQISVQSANAVAPRVDSLSAQLDSLRMTIDDLPQTLAISRIEDRLGELADKVSDLNQEVANSHSSEQPTVIENNASPHITADEFVSLEKRLDEIARALVAVSNTGRNAPKIDMSAVDRVEARMTDLARTLDSVAEQGDSEDLNKLSVRIEGLTERLASFEKYAEKGDLGGANALFAAPDTGVIEDQLKALNSRIDEVTSQTGSDSLEALIQQLSQRVEEASAHHSTSAQISGLENQINHIIQHMDGMGGAASVDFTPVEARLGQIEHQLQTNQNFSLEAAQQAAQHAVSMLGPQSENGSVIEALAHDLKSLQLLAEGNAAQSNQSVQQVHQALQQVVDRLADIEGTLENEAVRQATMVAPQVAPAHGLAMPVAASLPEQNSAQLSADGMPEGAAEPDGLVDAAIADENLGVVNQAALDAGITDSLNPAEQRQAPAEPIISAPSAPENMPLEPGSAAPNIDDIVSQASAKLNETHAKLASESMKMDADAKLGDDRTSEDLRPDAVAAARRALQATTAEMAAARDEVGEGSEGSASKLGKLDLLSSLKKFDADKLRKPLVLGAAALLLAIVAFKGVGMFTGSKDRPVANLDKPAVEMSAKSGESTKAEGEKKIATAETPAKKAVRAVGTKSDTAPEMAAIPKADATPKESEQTAEVARALKESKPVSVPAATVETESATKPIAQSTDPISPTEQPEAMARFEPTEPVKKVYDVSADAGPAALVAAAASGDPKALFQLGMRYSDGKSVKRNMTESAKWFNRSAEAGFAPAQYSLGSLFEKGIGVERDVTQATNWYEKAAVQGNARAMHNLAVIYAMGNPPAVQPNMDVAVDWFKKAAQMGIKDSQFNLGILYGQGMGVPQNLVDSYKWFALAAKTGDRDANSKRDEVASAMDPDDLAFARKEVNNWAPSKLNEAVNRVAVPEEWRGRSNGDRASNERAAQGGISQSASVLQAQDMLNQRGFNVGEPDGLIGPKTKRAIMEFQKIAGIPITGEVDQKLLQALEL